MEKYSELTENFIKDTVEALERTNDQKILTDIAEDLNIGPRFKLLAEQIVEYALKNNKLTNSFFLLKSVSRNPDQREHSEELGYAGAGKDSEKIATGVELFKGTLIRMLEKMRLEKSREELVKCVVMDDDEITPENIYSKEVIDNFNYSDFEVILHDELEEKYSGKPIIISE